MRKIGVWMDKEKAHVVVLTADSEDFYTILSNIEFFNLKSGSKPGFKTGATQHVIHEQTYLAREKQQMKAYFKKLAKELQQADSVMLFGPADTNEKFRKELHEHYKEIGQKIKAVLKADSMTDNQVKAFVRDFYK
ncbi:hypothetical protein U1E44_03740 [Arenibacter sp. GZD96]|uniref:hypothetical protein n=1 Tax=Aurantibrevibacter litoralis TaxID=3106030 RepID=UPI002AFE7136|nr:hypothetical protein [Arenibacter sp. GZD-96]MEA1785191.1 hypothetical protein [Arenibacter sp. GZD-96]